MHFPRDIEKCFPFCVLHISIYHDYSGAAAAVAATASDVPGFALNFRQNGTSQNGAC